MPARSKPMARISAPPTAWIAAITEGVITPLRLPAPKRDAALDHGHGDDRQPDPPAQRRCQRDGGDAVERRFQIQRRRVTQPVLDRTEHGHRTYAEQQGRGHEAFHQSVPLGVGLLALRSGRQERHPPRNILQPVSEALEIVLDPQRLADKPADHERAHEHQRCVLPEVRLAQRVQAADSHPRADDDRGQADGPKRGIAQPVVDEPAERQSKRRPHDDGDDVHDHADSRHPVSRSLRASTHSSSFSQRSLSSSVMRFAPLAGLRPARHHPRDARYAWQAAPLRSSTLGPVPLRSCRDDRAPCRRALGRSSRARRTRSRPLPPRRSHRRH